MQQLCRGPLWAAPLAGQQLGLAPLARGFASGPCRPEVLNASLDPILKPAPGAAESGHPIPNLADRRTASSSSALRSRSRSSSPPRSKGSTPSTYRSPRGPGAVKAQIQVRLAATKATLTDKTELKRKVKRGLAKLAKKAWEVTKKVTVKTGSLTWAFVKNPRIVNEWYDDLRETAKHFLDWVKTGFKLFGADVRASWFLIQRVAKGYPLKVRERQLLVRTISDCLKLIPFSFFLIVPFAELALPFVLRLFPNMLPSTFFQQKYDDATLARKFKAKEEMAEFFQEVVHQRTKEIIESKDDKFADKKAELQQFQEKLMAGEEFPTLKEILRFAKLFQSELTLQKMSDAQLSALSRMLGLPQAKFYWPGHLEVQLRHHINHLRREDRDYLWEGIDGISRQELVEACRSRAIRFHGVTDEQMRQDLTRWLELSANHREIPTSMLLWIQSFYLRGTHNAEREEVVSELIVKETPVEAEAAQEAEKIEEAFQGLAERQKAYAESAEEKLQERRREISEVMQSSLGEAVIENFDDKERELGGMAFEKIEAEKRKLSTEMQHLSQTATVYKNVVQRQKALLDEQLQFLLSMRENKPTQNKDADMILLDQRIRLMEMVGAFEKSYEDIELVLKEAGEESLVAAEPPAAPAATSSGVAEPAAAPVAAPTTAAPSDFASGFADKSFGDTGLPAIPEFGSGSSFGQRAAAP